MNNFIICKDQQTAIELQSSGCKLISNNDGIYTLVNCSDKLDFNNYKDRIVLTNKLKF